MKEFFKDLKIIELAGVLAGPSVGMFFAEFGARVIKIENPKGIGDVTRSWLLPGEKGTRNISAYFSSINYHKEYIKIDLKSPDGQMELRDLVSDADIFLTNHKKGRDIKYGFDYGSFKTINPELIYCHLEGFDSNENRNAFDVVLQAESGYMFMNGNKKCAPLKMPVALIDVLAAHQMKEGILMALLKRANTGEGSFVSCSLEKASFANLTNQASNYLMTGHIPQPIGSIHPNIAPYGDTFECRDGKHLVLAVGSDKHFQKMCAVMELNDLAFDERFMYNKNRVVNRNKLDGLLQPVFAQRDRDYWMDKFITHEIPAGAVKDMSEVFENPVAKSMVLEEIIDGVKTSRLSNIAFEIE